MNENVPNFLRGLIIGIVMVTFFILTPLITINNDKKIDLKNLKQEAIQLNYAEYNSTNGVWQWKTNLENKK